MKSLLSCRPVLWFLFLFNAAIALAVGIGGSKMHLHGHEFGGSQGYMTSAGMGVVGRRAAHRGGPGGRPPAGGTGRGGV